MWVSQCNIVMLFTGSMPRVVRKKNFRRRKKRAPSKSNDPQLPVRRMQWTVEQMNEAIECALSGATSANKAAEMYGVPKSTLKDRLSGRVVHGCRPGPRPYLIPSEEAELASHLVAAASMGVGKTRREVMGIAEQVAASKGVLKSERLSSGWWRGFLRRHPALRLRAGDATAAVRMDAVNEENIHTYFSLLKEVYDEFEFEAFPQRIYNMDETGVPLDPRPPKVVAPKGQKKVRYRCSGQKSQITVVACCNATGHAIPPFIIFAAKQLNALWMRDEVPGSRYAVSDNGWIDQDLFHFWLTEHFLQHAVSNGPTLLLLDGHSSHFKPATIDFAKQHNVVVFCLPPHTTHECQPLDCSFFAPLKAHWRQVCHDFHQKHPSGVISKLNFTGLFKQAWLKSISAETIVNGFKKSGVFPFDPNKVVTSSSECGESSDIGQSTQSDDSSGTDDDDCDASDKEDPVDDECPSESGVMKSGCSAADILYCEETLSLGDSEDECSFSAEQEALYKRRLEEGYDLHDSMYLKWLEKFHSDSVPANRHISTSVSTPQVSLLSQNVDPSHGTATLSTDGLTSKVALFSSTTGGPTTTVALSTMTSFPATEAALSSSTKAALSNTTSCLTTEAAPSSSRSRTGGPTTEAALSSSRTCGPTNEAALSSSKTGGPTTEAVLSSSRSMTGGPTTETALSSSRSKTGGLTTEAALSSKTGGLTTEAALSSSRSRTGGPTTEAALSSSRSKTGDPTTDAALSSSRTCGPTTEAALSSSKTGGPTIKAALSSSKTGGSTTEAALSSSKTGGPTIKAALFSSKTGGPTTEAALSSSKTGGSTTEAALSSSKTGGPTIKAALSSSKTGGSTTEAALSSSRTGGPTTEAALSSSRSKTGDPTTEAALSSSRTCGPTTEAALSSSKTGGPTIKAALSSSKTGGSTTEAALSSSRTGSPTTKAALFSPTDDSTSKAVLSSSPTSGSASTVIPSTSPTSESDSSTSTPSSSKSLISSFLPSLPDLTPSRSKSKKQSGARVLTSKECLDLLKEKEAKKLKDKEDKERRKLERERKKEERQKELQRKAEERALKAAEKQKKLAEKEKRAQERSAQKVRQSEEKGARVPVTRKRARSTAAPLVDTKVSENELRSKMARIIDESIDVNRCCACFEYYADDAGTDREWIECSCGRWLHVDCTEDVIHDANGKELLCPVCLSSV